MHNVIYNDDCMNVLRDIESDSVDLIFTSPPYAERRKKVYGGEPEEYYVEWFLPIAFELKRVLKRTGSFFLNIKPHTVKGQRSLYVFDLVLALRREVCFWFVDELCWIKNAFPGKLKGRLKNGFEPIYHFTKDNPNQITFNPLACGTPVKAESRARGYRKQCGLPENGSGMTGMNTMNIRDLEVARPSNVIIAHNISNQYMDKRKHPATFPEKLVAFFIKTYTNEGDMVLDPFAGSGTTCVCAKELNRVYCGIEIKREYCAIACDRLGDRYV